jgi:hypothetical protein
LALSPINPSIHVRKREKILPRARGFLKLDQRQTPYGKVLTLINIFNDFLLLQALGTVLEYNSNCYIYKKVLMS